MIRRETLEFGWFFLSSYPWRSLAMVMALVLSSMADGVGILTLIPVLEIAVDSAGAGQSQVSEMVKGVFATLGVEPTLEAMLVTIVLLMVIKAVLVWVAARQVGFTVAHVTTDLRLRLLTSLMEANWAYFVRQPTGRFTNALGWESGKASSSYQQFTTLLAGIVSVAIYVIAATMVSWPVVVVAVLSSFMLMFLMRGLISVSRRSGNVQARVMRSLSSRLTDLLNGIKPVKAMGREKKLWPLLIHETREFNTALRTDTIAKSSLEVIREPVIAVGLAIALYFVVSHRAESLSTVLVLALLVYRIVNRLSMLQQSYQRIQVGESAFFSLMDSIHQADSHRERTMRQGRIPTLQSSIVLESVRFGYGDQEILKGVSLEVPARQFVAVVGPSGSGKTTLIDLIIGLYQPNAGRILVDGLPLPDLDMQAYRRMIGYVPQELFLFHDTIRNNITLGDQELGVDECIEALRKAEALEFVESLPQGLETVVGERGARLSGGQRQRIALARALAHRPELLILDEVTSGLDPRTEREICNTLKGLRSTATIIAVSHQTALMMAADVVYGIRNGELIRQGEDVRGRVGR